MPRVDSQQPLLPSVLDRLIDREPDVSTEPAWRQSISLRELQTALLRDLEALLNTRQKTPPLPADFQEARKSILAYGLPDFTAFGASSAEQREVLRHAIESAIALFEPRLREMQITLHAPAGEHDRTLRMTIDALLQVDPDPLPITFDTVVQPSSGTCQLHAK